MFVGGELEGERSGLEHFNDPTKPYPSDPNDVACMVLTPSSEDGDKDLSPIVTVLTSIQDSLQHPPSGVVSSGPLSS